MTWPLNDRKAADSLILINPTALNLLCKSSRELDIEAKSPPTNLACIHRPTKHTTIRLDWILQSFEFMIREDSRGFNIQ